MKRHALFLAGVGAMLPMAMLGAGAVAGEPASQGRFEPPPPGAAFILSRELRRPLPDGKEVVSRRSYEIHIVPDGDGYRVDGTLVSAEVDAPPSLAMLAEIERKRPDEGLFPARLDAQGMIVVQNVPDDPEATRSATASIGLMVSRSAMSEADRSAAQGFLQRLGAPNAARGAAWPRDLFRPAAGEHRETSTVALPGGDTGTVTVATQASAQRGTGLLQRVERTVTTDFAGTERVTRELWRMEPAAGGGR